MNDIDGRTSQCTATITGHVNTCGNAPDVTAKSFATQDRATAGVVVPSTGLPGRSMPATAGASAAEGQTGGDHVIQTTFEAMAGLKALVSPGGIAEDARGPLGVNLAAPSHSTKRTVWLRRNQNTDEEQNRARRVSLAMY